jgi:hypothetical protein
MFTLFSNLPPELQLLIWSFVEWEPQVVEVTARCNEAPIASRQLARSGENGSRFHIRNYKPPTLLHVCYDTRLHTLKSYCPVFPAQLAWPIYMNFEKDILHFTSLYTA